ncbi:MAG TPA: rhodanese-like domain-containing protein, partial [Anaerolineales bacterium]|nr:rhodanese-like domain-containing protein [Anaerolineales bacterium]
EAPAGADLDAAFQSFLDGMEAYNTTGLDALNLALGEEPPPYLLDVRTIEEVQEKGHIENAYLIPLRELGQNLDLLPSFDTQIVSYCGSGWRCTIAMTALGALGWQDVLSLKEGSFGGWVEAGYPVVDGLPLDAEPLNAAEPNPELVTTIDAMLQSVPDGYGSVKVDDLATELVENPDLTLIDVRRAEEITDKGVIDHPNQISIPLEDFIAMKDQWPADKDAEIVVYCGSGHRSTIAMTILWSYGYTNVRSMNGGFTQWLEAGYPVAEAIPTP